MAEVRKTLLVVDDTPDNVAVVAGILKENYRIKVATNGAKALEIAQGTTPPDLVLLDIMMPEMDGYEVCKRLRAHPRTMNIPVIFLTARSTAEDETHGFEVGAVDYILKPFVPAVVKARVGTHLALVEARELLLDHNKTLERLVTERTHELSQAQDATIIALASLAETRDNETGNHIRRTQHYVRLLAERLAWHPRFAKELTRENIEQLFKSAPLHDIGKVGIPDAILLKPGKLTPEEFEVMKTHTQLGHDAIVTVEALLGTSNSFLRFAREIALTHQEKWDGSGYPQGLAGDAIPISGRLMALADVYDALISRRVYKPPFPHEQAAQLIIDGSGTHFDPDMVEAFVDLQGAFFEIAQRYSDEVS